MACIANSFNSSAVTPKMIAIWSMNAPVPPAQLPFIRKSSASPSLKITILACVARENVKKAGLSNRINVIYADARDYIPYLDTDEEYDLIFLDGPKAHYINMLDDSMRLLKTGGIVQGMSGSPIIQDGKLIGAVTHVLVNDPARGYGIFIENMLEAAG